MPNMNDKELRVYIKAFNASDGKALTGKSGAAQKALKEYRAKQKAKSKPKELKKRAKPPRK